jgi:hypothetical protein
VIYDDDDQLNLIKRALQEFNLDQKHVPRAILASISASKSRMQTPQDYAAASRSYFDEVVAGFMKDIRNCWMKPRPGLRRSAAENGQSLQRAPGSAEKIPGTLCPHHGRRVSGYQSDPV